MHSWSRDGGTGLSTLRNSGELAVEASLVIGARGVSNVESQTSSSLGRGPTDDDLDNGVIATEEQVLSEVFPELVAILNHASCNSSSLNGSYSSPSASMINWSQENGPSICMTDWGSKDGAPLATCALLKAKRPSNTDKTNFYSCISGGPEGFTYPSGKHRSKLFSLSRHIPFLENVYPRHIIRQPRIHLIQTHRCLVLIGYEGSLIS